MRLRELSVENVRSFASRQTLKLNGPVCIVVGPNGGGKTNLLDALVVTIRRYMLTSINVQDVASGSQKVRKQVTLHPNVQAMTLEKHWTLADREQVIEVEVEASQSDIENMGDIQREWPQLLTSDWLLMGMETSQPSNWIVHQISPGDRFRYRIEEGVISSNSLPAQWFLEYLKTFELYSRIRELSGISTIKFPILNLPTNRAASFTSSVQLSGYNQWDMKASTDFTYSRSGSSISGLAIGSLAKKFRLLLENDDGQALARMNSDPALAQMQNILGKFGYSWNLNSSNPLANGYDMFLVKEGVRFSMAAASSGEKEFMTYILAVFALDIRDALIVVDEPELHLHPRWQRALLDLFETLAESTGNQFLLATHSPSFISPKSIHYVSRVHSGSGESSITPIRLDPVLEAKGLLDLINSSNNERLFFADKVLLVEGVTDRIIMEAVIDYIKGPDRVGKVLEVLSVGGKAAFKKYEALLKASSISYLIMADMDYLDQIGPPGLKGLFKPNHGSIKKDVIDNYRSVDGKTLIEAIDNAISTGSWDNASDIWEYIKTRRIKMRDDLSSQEISMVQEHIIMLRTQNIHILTKGDLEQYLPPRMRGKDIPKLVEFVRSPEFRDEIHEYGGIELEGIARAALPD